MAMSLNDSDLEFILQLYDGAVRFIADKSKEDYATDFVFKLIDYGFDIKFNAKEIAEHDEYLAKAVTSLEEDEEWEDSDVWYEDEEVWDD